MWRIVEKAAVRLLVAALTVGALLLEGRLDTVERECGELQQELRQ